jgi:hypothetical protein
MKIICLILITIVKQILTLEIVQRDTMKLAMTKVFDVKQGCKEITIPNNFKKLLLKLKSTNLDKVLITDLKIDKCDDKNDIANCCQKNSTFCLENLNPTQNDFRLNYCIDYTYLYACAGNNTGNSSIQIESDIVRGQGCVIAEFIPETECSSMGLASCKDPNTCSRKCTYTECRKNANDPSSKVFSLCLPNSMTQSEIENKCHNHIEFTNKKPEIYTLRCNRTHEDEEYEKRESSHTFFKFLAVIFGVTVFTLFISSVVFRFKKNMDGTPLFDPPEFCPNFIYPR